MTESVQKIHREESTTVIWKLKGWGHGERNDLEVLEHLINASCCVDVDVGLGAYDDSPGARLRVYLKKGITGVIAVDSDGVPHPVYDPSNLDVCVKQLFKVNEHIDKYELEASLLDAQFELLNELPKELESISSWKLEFDERNGTWSAFARLDFEHLATQRPKYLGIRLCIRTIFSHETAAEVLHDHVQTTVAPSVRFNKALDKMSTFTYNQSYAIIKLETKDGEILTVCQLLLASRSPVLRDLIGKELDNCEFNGTLKLADVNAKPLKVILQWIYSGSLSKMLKKCMGEVVEAATRFRMTDLLDVLDRKMVTFCNRHNMFLLHQIALKNNMRIATAQVSKFIREN